MIRSILWPMPAFNQREGFANHAAHVVAMSSHEEPQLRSATELWLSVRASLFAAKYEWTPRVETSPGRASKARGVSPMEAFVAVSLPA